MRSMLQGRLVFELVEVSANSLMCSLYFCAHRGCECMQDEVVVHLLNDCCTEHHDKSPDGAALEDGAINLVAIETRCTQLHTESRGRSANFPIIVAVSTLLCDLYNNHICKVEDARVACVGSRSQSEAPSSLLLLKINSPLPASKVARLLVGVT